MSEQMKKYTLRDIGKAFFHFILSFQLCFITQASFADPNTRPHPREVLAVFEKHFPQNSSHASGLEGDVLLKLYIDSSNSNVAKSVIKSLKLLQKNYGASYPEFQQSSISEIFFEDLSSFEHYLKVQNKTAEKKLKILRSKTRKIKMDLNSHEHELKVVYIYAPSALLSLLVLNTFILQIGFINGAIPIMGIVLAAFILTEKSFSKDKSYPPIAAEEHFLKLFEEKQNIEKLKSQQRKWNALMMDLKSLYKHKNSCRNI